jgi:IS1 family transposase
VGTALIATDGLTFYAQVARQLYGLRCIFGEVDKTWRKDRVVKVERRRVIGSWRRFEEALEYSQDSAKLNTAYVERLNLTLRRSVSYLARRSPGHARCPRCLAHLLELARCHYDFVRPHAGLRFGQELRTPAMVAGLSQRVASFRNLFAPVPRNG